MLGDSVDGSAFRLDALLTKCRAGIDTYGLTQDSSSSRLRTVLYELHQAIYLFDKHKGYGFPLQPCLTLFNYFVAGLSDVLNALIIKLEHQPDNSNNNATDTISTSSQSPDGLTVAKILEQLEYFNFCIEILSTAVARGHDEVSGLWKAENSIKRLRGALDAFFQPPVRIKNTAAANGVWTLDKTQAAQFEHAQHLAQILGTSIISSTDSIKNHEELCAFRIKLAVHWYLTQCLIQHSGTSVKSNQNELLRVFDGIKSVWLIHDSLISVPSGDCANIFDAICTSLEDTILLQLERQYTCLSTIDYGYIVENADYGIVPRFMSPTKEREWCLPPSGLYFTMPASTSEMGLSPLSEPRFYSPVLSRAPPSALSQIKEPEAPAVLASEPQTAQSAQNGLESDAELNRSSLPIPSIVSTFRTLDEVCSIDDEVELENRETWDGFVDGILAKSSDIDIGDTFALVKVRIFRSHRNSTIRIWIETSKNSLHMIAMDILSDEIIPNYAWDEISQPSLELTLRYGAQRKEVRFKFPATQANVIAPSILYAFQGALTSSDFEGEYFIKSARFSGTLIPDTKDLRVQVWTEIQPTLLEGEARSSSLSATNDSASKQPSLDANNEAMSKSPCSKLYMFSEDQIYVILITDRVKVEMVIEGDRRNRRTAVTKLALLPNNDKGYSVIPFRIIRPSVGRHAGLRPDHDGQRILDQDTPKFTECRSITLTFNSKTSCTDFMANYLECKAAWETKYLPGVRNSQIGRDRTVNTRTRNILGGQNRLSFFSALS